MPAPILIIPAAFSPDLCSAMCRALDEGETRESGFMWPQEDGRIGERIEPRLKVRTDHYLGEDLAGAASSAIIDRVLPKVRQAFQFDVTRIERHMVARYARGGHFAAHKDDLLPGTRHRKFALSVILNDAFWGGALEFPEFGPDKVFWEPSGTAVVFSCSLEHRVTRVEEGARYAYLTFLYDEAGEALRQQELAQLATPCPANVTT
ncbi:2OG-Fe(II) oxygenase [Roseomonas mucosa]|uniref:2OG-Fe(II) oxygenase n=1 Tax=Roseomonas mucosa TaxID=207340 RepID=UPI00384B127B